MKLTVQVISLFLLVSIAILAFDPAATEATSTSNVCKINQAVGASTPAQASCGPSEMGSRWKFTRRKENVGTKSLVVGESE
jgi:hypothetical protein